MAGDGRMTTTQVSWRELTYSSRDGLRLHARHYPVPGSTARPAICIPGLTRNVRDFETLARYLSREAAAPRPVYALDLRGRGMSEHDKNWRNYSVGVEMHDVIDFMTTFGLFDAAMIGTSRGGLVTMLLAAAQPTRIGAAILNDIGPVIERDGLARIAGYVGRVPMPSSWQEAARIMRDLDRRQFPHLTDAQWEAIARQRFDERNGRPAASYDAQIGRSISVLEGPIPELWPQFAALGRVPLMTIRGANSDLLSEATLAEMGRRHPDMTTLVVPDQGHAPLLDDMATMSAIGLFLADTDSVKAYAAVAHAQAYA